jgi:hypothetical protein
VHPYRTTTLDLEGEPEAAAEVATAEDTLIYVLAFLVGAVGVVTAVADSTQSTAGALGALAMCFAVIMFVRDLARRSRRRRLHGAR